MTTTAAEQGATGQDVTELLASDHSEFLELVQQIKTTTDPAERRDLADTLIAELVRHSVAEEMFVYPAMSDHLPNGKEAVEHDTAEHKELERTMKDLEDYWIEINRLENEGDRAYRMLLVRLFSGEYDALTVLKMKEVADELEAACDAFEHVANTVETIAVKES